MNQSVMNPGFPSLSFIHKLQKEMRSEIKALKQGLDPEPTSPQGLPAWWAVAATGKVATQARHFLPENLGGHASRIKASLCVNTNILMAKITQLSWWASCLGAFAHQDNCCKNDQFNVGIYS